MVAKEKFWGENWSKFQSQKEAPTFRANFEMPREKDSDELDDSTAMMGGSGNSNCSTPEIVWQMSQRKFWPGGYFLSKHRKLLTEDSCYISP